MARMGVDNSTESDNEGGRRYQNGLKGTWKNEGIGIYNEKNPSRMEVTCVESSRRGR